MMTRPQRHRGTLARALILIVVALYPAGCGTGTDGKPAPPPAASPSPPSAPPSAEPKPILGARITVISIPSPYSGGYPEGEWIRLLAEFEKPLQVRGVPRVAIGIGGTTRYATFSPWVAHRISDPEHKQKSQVRRGFELAPRFDYLVDAADRDRSGISIASDAFDFTEGILVDAAGDEVDVEIYGVAPSEFGEVTEPGTDLVSHPVIGRPQPRGCTNEREQALAFGSGRSWGPPILISEWDGTPFRFYFSLVGLPESARPDAERVLDVVEQMSEQITEQIGYPILEVGGWERDSEIAWPDFRDRQPCSWRTRGQIIGMATDDPDVPGAAANPKCAVWAKGGSFDFANGTVAHEIFHLFGFTHHPQDWRGPGQVGHGVFMSRRLNGAYVDRDDVPLSFEDMDALRCIFPRGG